MTPDKNVTNSPQVAVKTRAVLSEETDILEEPQEKGGHVVNITSEHTEYVLYLLIFYYFRHFVLFNFNFNFTIIFTICLSVL